jgi:glycyl-tRNA synthetase
MGAIAYKTVSTLRQLGLSVSYDDSGSIGKRYRRQDEVGTPFCVTIDYQTMEDNTATLRDRDSAQQKRIDLNSLPPLLTDLKKGILYFEDIDSSIITI